MFGFGRRRDRPDRTEKKVVKRDQQIEKRKARALVFKWGAIGLAVIAAIIAMMKWG